MRSVTYSMSVSLDGFIVGPDGDFDWALPRPLPRNMPRAAVRVASCRHPVVPPVRPICWSGW